MKPNNKTSFSVINTEENLDLSKEMAKLYNSWDTAKQQRYKIRRERAIAILLGEFVPPVEFYQITLNKTTSNPKKCTCLILNLMTSGCKCGGV